MISPVINEKEIKLLKNRLSLLEKENKELKKVLNRKKNNKFVYLYCSLPVTLFVFVISFFYIFADKEEYLKVKKTKELISSGTNIEKIKIKKVNADMILISSGSFLMGSNKGGKDEKPIHKVTISDFYIGKYEVTNLEYANFLNEYGSDVVNEGKYKGKPMIFESDWGLKKIDEKWIPQKNHEKYPVICVTWYGAFEYCRFYGGRLPSEAEWEYAAKAGNKMEKNKNIFAGSNDINEVAWFDENTNYKPHKVGLKKANKANLYDMSGSVREWCRDWYDKNFYKTSSQNNPVNNNKTNIRVLRGGSWDLRAFSCRSANRDWDYPGDWNSSIGFRFSQDYLSYVL